MTNIRSIFGCFVIAASLSACTGGAPSSSSASYATAEKLKAYQTYEFSADRTLSLRDPKRNTAEAKSMIDQAVESGLRDKGLTRSSGGPADLLVHYGAGSRDMFSSQTFTESGEWSQSQIQEAGGSGQLSERTGTLNTDYEQGRLILDVKDRKTGKVVYRGTTEAELLEQPNAGRSAARLRKAVKGMLKNWPTR